MALKHRIARLERELPTAPGPPAAVFVTYPIVEIVENGKRVERLGEGIPWPPGSTIQPGRPYKVYIGIDEEDEPGWDIRKRLYEEAAQAGLGKRIGGQDEHP
jgi:hypothetical protein